MTDREVLEKIQLLLDDASAAYQLGRPEASEKPVEDARTVLHDHVEQGLSQPDELEAALDAAETALSGLVEGDWDKLPTAEKIIKWTGATEALQQIRKAQGK